MRASIFSKLFPSFGPMGPLFSLSFPESGPMGPPFSLSSPESGPMGAPFSLSSPESGPMGAPFSLSFPESGPMGPPFSLSSLKVVLWDHFEFENPEHYPTRPLKLPLGKYAHKNENPPEYLKIPDPKTPEDHHELVKEGQRAHFLREVTLLQ